MVLNKRNLGGRIPKIVCLSRGKGKHVLMNRGSFSPSLPSPALTRRWIREHGALPDPIRRVSSKPHQETGVTLEVAEVCSNAIQRQQRQLFIQDPLNV